MIRIDTADGEVTRASGVAGALSLLQQMLLKGEPLRVSYEDCDTVIVSAAPDNHTATGAREAQLQRQLDTLRDQVTAYRAECRYELEQLAGRVNQLEALREIGGDDSRECGGCSSGFAKVAGRYLCVDCGRDMGKRGPAPSALASR